MVETVTTTDLYASTYYLLTGCEIEAIEGVRVNGKITCRLSFRSPRIPQLQMDYFQGGAEVNLLQFRRAMATHLLRNQTDLRHIQAILGHAQITSTELYIHLALEDLKEVIRRSHPHGKSKKELE